MQPTRRMSLAGARLIWHRWPVKESNASPTWEPRTAWREFRLEAEAAQHYPVSCALYIGQTLRHALLELLLPGLLYIKAAAILDDALDTWLNNNSHALATPYKNDLNGRLTYLADRQLLSGAVGLHEVRKLRNALAHEPRARWDWAALSIGIGKIETSLAELGLVAPGPTLEHYAERSALAPSEKPGVEWERTFEYGVRENGRPALEVKWTQYLHGLSAETPPSDDTAV